VHRLVTGTHTSDGEQNYLQIVSCQMPNEQATVDARKYDDEKGGASLIPFISLIYL
jgi:hypothetical protein